jgi:hypothetical protein
MGQRYFKKMWKTHGERPSEKDLQMVGNLHGASSRCSIRCWEMWKKWRGIGIELPGDHYYCIIFYYILYFYITLYYIICVYIYVYLCIYVSMYPCIYVSMYLCISVSMYLCMYACMHACMYVCLYIP